MMFFEGNDFSILYLQMLEQGYYSPNSFVNSRSGSVKDLGPTCYIIRCDKMRLPKLYARGINPFFALVEFSWIITGSNQVAPLEYFISKYSRFSDDGTTLNGAYGFRLRQQFGVDQIENAIYQLRTNPNSRRVVLSMWSVEDLNKISNDLPCNTCIYLKIRNGYLDITILNRSNDLFLGVPYNAFVFHLLQVYIAEKLQCKVGVQRHFTDSLHIYQQNMESIKRTIMSNNEKMIKNLDAKLGSFNIGSYTQEDHRRIVSLQFNEIQNISVKKMFQAYEIYKKTNDINRAIPLLPADELGYLGYLWFKEKRQTIETSSLFYSIYEGAKVVNGDFDVLDTLKYENVDVIISCVTELTRRYIDKFDTILEVVNKKNRIMGIGSGVDNTKLIIAVFLSLVLSTISNNYSSGYARNSLIEKIQSVCEIFELEFDDINNLTKYESEFRRVLSK